MSPPREDMRSYGDRFIATIVADMSDPGRVIGEETRLEGIGIDPEGAVIVVYRQKPNSRMLGRRFDLQKFAQLFDPTSPPEVLARIALVDDIFDPSGPGTRLNVSWAEGIVDNPDEIEWHGWLS